MESIPCRCKRWESTRPAGPAPTIPTCVRCTVGMKRVLSETAQNGLALLSRLLLACHERASQVFCPSLRLQGLYIAGQIGDPLMKLCFVSLAHVPQSRTPHWHIELPCAVTVACPRKMLVTRSA